MRTNARLFILVILLGSGLSLTTLEANAHRRHVYQSFYYDLMPYGNWINTPDYGLVWVPAVNNRFHPYETNGYWTYTGYGWTWVSYYSWGWAPFHYGRWYFDPWYGWAWVPGQEWGPGWVAWSHCNGYYGWAPLTPGFSLSVSVSVPNLVPVNHWVYVPTGYFGAPDQSRHHMQGERAERLHRNADVILSTTSGDERNSRFFRGPEVNEVRKVTGREFRQSGSGNKEYTRRTTDERSSERIRKEGTSRIITANTSISRESRQERSVREEKKKEINPAVRRNDTPKNTVGKRTIGGNKEVRGVKPNPSPSGGKRVRTDGTQGEAGK